MFSIAVHLPFLEVNLFFSMLCQNQSTESPMIEVIHSLHVAKFKGHIYVLHLHNLLAAFYVGEHTQTRSPVGAQTQNNH